jgi:hypothetical protein
MKIHLSFVTSLLQHSQKIRYNKLILAMENLVIESQNLWINCLERFWHHKQIYDVTDFKVDPKSLSSILQTLSVQKRDQSRNNSNIQIELNQSILNTMNQNQIQISEANLHSRFVMNRKIMTNLNQILTNVIQWIDIPNQIQDNVSISYLFVKYNFKHSMNHHSLQIRK